MGRFARRSVPSSPVTGSELISSGITGLAQACSRARASCARDARVARQARAVVEHHARSRLAEALGQPWRSTSRARRRRADAACREAERQEQLLRHHVVAELVDVAHQPRPAPARSARSRRGLWAQRRRGRCRASLPPSSRHRPSSSARVVARRIGVRDRPELFAAASGKLPAKRTRDGSLKSACKRAAPVAAGRVGQAARRIDLHAGERRVRRHARAPARRVGHEGAASPT